MEQKKISIQGVPETMLQTLYARAKESKKTPHYIYDEKAIEIVSKLDYDFGLAEKDAVMSSGVIARTIVLDQMVQDFLILHPNTVVINIACGLDTRCYRMQGLYRKWYNLDLPETMEIRKHFMDEQGPIYQITSSAMDPEWTEEIQIGNEQVLIIIEGLTMYLTEHDVIQIFDLIKNKFHQVTIFVETMSPLMAKHIKEKSIEGSKAKFKWGIKNGKEMERIIPAYHCIKEVSLVEGMKVFMPIYRVIGKIGWIRNMSDKILVMERNSNPIEEFMNGNHPM